MERRRFYTPVNTFTGHPKGKHSTLTKRITTAVLSEGLSGGLEVESNRASQPPS